MYILYSLTKLSNHVTSHISGFVIIRAHDITITLVLEYKIC